ncbi:MAG: nucleotidyltransferase domain-containing protein [Spirochaetes bacterium]|nr:nucleotidyltransferase domain-containing protein [Spirochaetota bacterium]
MQEIGRIIDKKPGVFQRTLNNFVDEGILESERRANARYFWINKKYSLYKELHSIVFKTVGILGSLKDALGRLNNIKFAFIYGSYAKGKEVSLSDVDLMIIGTPNEGILIKDLDRLEVKLKRDINYKLYSLKCFKADVKNKNAFLLEVVNDKKIMLIGSTDELRKIS